MCKEYKVIGDGFSILDIYKKRTSCQKFSEEFQALLEEEIVNKNHIHECFISYGDIKHSKVLMRNLDWLEDKGFIKEDVKDIVLEVGMRLRSEPGHVYIVSQNHHLVDIVRGFELEYGDGSKTLNELNKIYPSSKFEVVYG